MAIKKVKNESGEGGGFKKFSVYLHCKIGISAERTLSHALISLIVSAVWRCDRLRFMLWF